MPSVRAADEGIPLPPAGVAYQVRFVPVMTISDNAGFVPLQNDWSAVPAGAAGVVFTVVVTASRPGDSHPFTVWLA